MSEGYFHGGQHEARRTECRFEEAVVGVVSVLAVPDDRVEDVLQVATQLVRASGLRLEPNEGRSGGIVSRYRAGDFEALHGAPDGDRFPCRAWSSRIPGSGERVVDHAVQVKPAADQRQVLLVHVLPLEQGGHGLCGLRREAEQQNAGGRFVQTMDRIYTPTQLIPHQLKCRDFIPVIHRGAMDKKPGRLVHGDEMIVEVENGQGSS